MEKVNIDLNLEQMLVSAVRYAIGRRTYIVQATVDYIICILPKLSLWCVNVIRESIVEEIELAERLNKPEMLGAEIDRKQWGRMMTALDAELEGRKNHEDRC